MNANPSLSPAAALPAALPAVLSAVLPVVPFARNTPPAAVAVTLPGSKSITNRALILAALGTGVTRLEGALFSRDTRVMCAALRELGFGVETDERARSITVTGTGGNIPRARAALNVGNAGTAARFLTALLALHPDGEFALDGDVAMRGRPMRGLLDALRSQGTEAFAPDGAPAVAFPFTLKTRGLRGGEIVVDASASSQILSALLMVAPFATSPATVCLRGETVSEPFVEMTRRMVAEMGSGKRGTGNGEEAQGEKTGENIRRYAVEPDATAGSYFLALPVAAPALTVLVRGLRETSAGGLQGDTEFAGVLRALGLDVRATAEGFCAKAGTGGGINATGGAPLVFDFNAISDTFLTLAALAPLLPAPVTIRGVAHARRQETDRLLGVARELESLGQRVAPSAAALAADPALGEITIFPDRAALLRAADNATGSGGLAHIRTYDDHRFAMSFAILGCHDLRGDGSPWLAIEDPACCAKTFPDFFATLDSLRRPSRTRL